MTYTKRELEKYGARFTKPLFDTVEISWTIRGGGRERLRLTRNGDSFNIAGTGRGGTFRLSYQYLTPSLQLTGFGPARICALINDHRHGLCRYTDGDFMTSLLTAMIDIARRQLLSMKRETTR